MRVAMFCRILSIMTAFFCAAAFVPTWIIALYYGENGTPQLQSIFITLALAAILFSCSIYLRKKRANSQQNYEFKTRDGFIITALFWGVLGSLGTLPFILSHAPEFSVADAFFESYSGLTTTGATVLTGIDNLPHGLRMYRQVLQWIGGIGIIVIAVAVMPALGVGGLQLYRSEVPGPVKDAKLTPRIAETAKSMTMVYLILTFACAGALMLAGVSAFDAFGHAFSTIATGGNSTHDASIGYFNSPTVTAIITVFMVLAGINFGLHFIAWHSSNLRSYLYDAECRMYLLILLGATIISAVMLILYAHRSVGNAFLNSSFMVASIMTSTGFGVEDFTIWPHFLPIMLFFLSFIGGCAGSTAGGTKVMRFLLLLKQGSREMYRLVHPNAVRHIKLNGKVVPDRVLQSVWGFYSVYLMCYAISVLVFLMQGHDLVTSFSAIASAINNLGPGLGEVSSNYGVLSDSGKYILTFLMVLGRLEIFTLLILFTPTFWRN